MTSELFKKLEGIQAVVFDAYGTLFNVASPVDKLASTIGEKSIAVAKLWRQKQLEYTWLRSLMGVHADFWTVTREALDHTLESYEIVEPGLADELMTLYLKLDVFDDVATTVAALRAKGRRCAVLSNGSPSMLDSALRHAGIEKHFEHVLSVEEVGVYKPSRRVYRLVLQKMQVVDAPSICFVSANSWDAQAGAQFGFQAVRLARTSVVADRIPGKPTAVIDSLGKLLELV
ncbi:MAG: haloacid dehalogenase type II [Alphaproteobacteria bacterium]|nr:haloacid dehalogenase type II [Alphaproteobacteria bacterium]